MKNAKVTDLAVVTNEQKAVGALMTTVFRDVDFNSLNTIIDKLGDSSAVLGQEEKVAAVQIVTEWENNVISRMRSYSSKMSSMVNAFSLDVNYSTWLGSDHVGELSMPQIEQMIIATGTKTLWEVALGHYEAMQEYLDDNTPEKGYVDDNMSANEIIRVTRKYELEMARHNTERTRLERKVKMAFREFMRNFLKNTLVKDMVAKARSYNTNLNDALTECHMKSNMAKLNIQIASADVRGAIHELLAFSSGI